MTTPAAPHPPGGVTTSGIPASRRKLPTAASSGADSDSATPPNRRPVASDPLSDRTTSILIRRVLCPQQQLGDKNRDAFVPIEQLLPPLTSRNDVDLQLYAFLAIILRDFVQTWYGKITTDETFVAEIVHIVAHCTTALEQRFRQVDLECLLLDEVPDLLDRHITAYRTSHHSLPSPPIEVDPREVYHSLCPLPHLSPVPRPADEASIREQQENEALYRQLLVQAVLAVLLPTEDLENPCLTSLVGQIFSELIIGNVIANRAAQPWLLWEGICILARVFEEKKAHAKQRLVGRSSLARPDGKSSWRWAVHSFFLFIINLVILFITSIRLAASAIMVPSSLPPRVAVTNDINADWESLDGGDEYHKPPARQSTTACTKDPILDFSFWSCAAHLIELPTRMPWLSGFASIVQYAAMNGPGHLGRLNGTLDRLLSHCIQSSLHPSRLAPLLRTLRGILFPNNSPGKSSLLPPSSDAELQTLRRKAARAIWGLLPETIGTLYLGGRLSLGRSHADVSDNLDSDGGARDQGTERNEEMVDEVEHLLMVLSDEYCNKHLLYNVLELILVRLMPELTEKGVGELWDERLG